MKLTKALGLLGISVTPFVTADFHLFNAAGAYIQSNWFSCPSNYFTETCWCSDGGYNRKSTLGYVEQQTNGEYKVTLDSVCGVAAIDFWYRSGPDMWEGYIPNADGHVVATCYRQPKLDDGYPDDPYTVIGECNIWSKAVKYDVLDAFVCYSEICGHA